jgi:hypothetical protein
MPAGAQPQPEVPCQILDQPEVSLWNAGFGYLAEVEGEGFAKLGITELQAHSGLAYFTGRFGTLDVQGLFDALYFTGEGTVPLPDAVGQVRLDVAYTLRLRDGVAVRVAVAPGLYSDLTSWDSEYLHYPFRLHVIRALTPDSSGMVGLDFYPGFDRVLHPRIGARWTISEYLRFDLFYPRTELLFRPNWRWNFRAGVQFLDYLEYRLEQEDARESMLLKETRFYLGMDVGVSNDLFVQAQLGRSVDRSLEFRRNEPQRDLDDGYYFRLGIGRRL